MARKDKLTDDIRNAGSTVSYYLGVPASSVPKNGYTYKNQNDRAAADRDAYDVGVRNRYGRESLTATALQNQASYWDNLAYEAAQKLPLTLADVNEVNAYDQEQQYKYDLWNAAREVNKPKTTPDYPDYGGGGGGTPVSGTPATSLLSSQITAPSYAELPDVTSKYGALVDELVGRVLNRDPFSYDYETDPLYQQYAKSYGDAGRRAMQDTLAQISARTGGLASSYAGSASQQAYNNYMARLADKIPELQQLAYQMYQDEGNNLRSDLSMLSDLDDTSYSRSADAWNRAYQLSNDEYERNMELAKLAAGYNDLRGINELGIDTSKAKLSGGGSGSGKSSSSARGDEYTPYFKDPDDVLKYMDAGITSPYLDSDYEHYFGTSPSGSVSSEPEITNHTTANTVLVPGYGGLTWDILYNMVDAGYVSAEYSDDGKKLTFKKA